MGGARRSWAPLKFQSQGLQWDAWAARQRRGCHHVPSREISRTDPLPWQGTEQEFSERLRRQACLLSTLPSAPQPRPSPSLGKRESIPV